MDLKIENDNGRLRKYEGYEYIIQEIILYIRKLKLLPVNNTPLFANK